MFVAIDWTPEKSRREESPAPLFGQLHFSKVVKNILQIGFGRESDIGVRRLQRDSEFANRIRRVQCDSHEPDIRRRVQCASVRLQIGFGEWCAARTSRIGVGECCAARGSQIGFGDYNATRSLQIGFGELLCGSVRAIGYQSSESAAQLGAFANRIRRAQIKS
jgi:hypothetical protein